MNIIGLNMGVSSPRILRKGKERDLTRKSKVPKVQSWGCFYAHILQEPLKPIPKAMPCLEIVDSPQEITSTDAVSGDKSMAQRLDFSLASKNCKARSISIPPAYS